MNSYHTRFRALVLIGSIRSESFTRVLTKHVQDTLKRHNIECTIWDLKDRPLPITDPAFHSNPEHAADKYARGLAVTARQADSLILASPIYHNSYSGVLKNALDAIAIPQVAHKPFGLLSHGGNRSPQAVDHLRIVVRGLLGVAIPTQVCTAAQDFSVSPHSHPERISDPSILERIERFSAEFAMYTATLHSMRQGSVS